MSTISTDLEVKLTVDGQEFTRVLSALPDVVQMLSIGESEPAAH